MQVLGRLRPFAPGLRKFLLVIACLQAVAAAQMVNSVVALSMLITFTASLVRIYQVDPEPVLLLMLHTVISGCMLYDVISTLCVISAGMTSLICLGGCEMNGERVVVLVLSTLFPALLVKPLAIVACVIIGAAIVAAKLRPLRPPMLLLVALSFIALTLLVNRAAGSILVFVLMGIITALFVANKISSEDDLPTRTSSRAHHDSGNNNSNHNRSNDVVPNGYLQLSNPIDSLDLHGHTVTGAMRVLHTFLRENEEAYKQNRSNHLRHVTIITGEGHHDDVHGPAPLIKPTVVNFLKINKYKHEISSETPGLIKVDLESHVM